MADHFVVIGRVSVPVRLDIKRLWFVGERLRSFNYNEIVDVAIHLPQTDIQPFKLAVDQYEIIDLSLLVAVWPCLKAPEVAELLGFIDGEVCGFVL